MSKESQKNTSIMNWLGEVSSNILNRLQTTKFRQLPSPSSENQSPISCDTFISPDIAENTQNDRSQLKNLSLSSLPSPGQSHFRNYSRKIMYEVWSANSTQ